MQVKSDDFNNFYIEISDFYSTATRRRKGGGEEGIRFTHIYMYIPHWLPLKQII